MVPLWKSVIFSSFYLISNAQDYSLGDWSVTGALNTATTQFYGAVDQETSTAYVSGGLVSDTQAKNLVESIKFDVEDDTLTINSEHVSNLYVAELGLQWSLSTWYGKQQSAGFYDDNLYIIEPIYAANPTEHYFLKCDVVQQSCSFEATHHLTEQEPCITQKGEFLYIVGGLDPSNITTSQHINIYSMANDEWFVDPFGPLSIGQVYHSCAICGDHLYTFGGDIGSDALNTSESYTGLIQKCDLNGVCQILDLAYNNVRYSRATTINDDVIILAGGQFSASEYTHNVDIFDCRNDEMIAGPDLPSPLTEFQMGTVYNDSFVCIFGGQTIEDETFKISAEILCAPVIQDGIARYTFAAPLVVSQPESTPAPQQVATPTPIAIAQDSTPSTSSSSTSSTSSTTTTTTTTTTSTTTTSTRAPSTSSTSTPSDNAESGGSANDNQLLDEFENESNSNAAVIYGIVFGIIICAICILIVVIYKTRRSASDRRSLARAQTADDNNFVVAKINESESDDELGIGHPHEKQHTIIESGASDESDADDN